MNDFATADDVRSLSAETLPRFVARFAAVFAAGLLLSLPISLWLGRGLESIFGASCLAAFVAARMHRRTPFLSRSRFLLAAVLAVSLTGAAVPGMHWFGWNVPIMSCFLQTLIATLAVAAVHTVSFLRICLVTPGAA